jgi:hypothetical protein
MPFRGEKRISLIIRLDRISHFRLLAVQSLSRIGATVAQFLLYFLPHSWHFLCMAKQALRDSVNGHDLDGNPIVEVRSVPAQLSLFQSVLSPASSSTIELYDAIPKYYYSPKDMEALRRKNGGQFLETLTRKFESRSQKYTVAIRPARIKSDDGSEREVYPTEREHLIEQALRKLATNPMNGIYLSGGFGVQFSLSELRRELERTGHSITYRSLIEGLKVNNATHLALTTEDGATMISAPIFPTLMLTSRQEWEEDPKNARCYVKFNPLVTASIEELTYRQMNYETLMKLERSLSRYLFQRMSHLYVQADFMNPYRIALDTLVRDSGMAASRNASDNAKRVERTLDELSAADVIMRWEKDVERGPHNRLVNVVYTLTPSFGFKDDAVRANKKHAGIR